MGKTILLSIGIILILGITIAIALGIRNRYKFTVKNAEDSSDMPHPSLKTTIPAAIVTGGVLLCVAITALSCFYVVGAREVGVKVAFGKVKGVVDSGPGLKAPWTQVEVLDGTVQNDIYKGDHQIQVRLGNNSKAEADVSIQWQLKTQNAQELYLNYKTFDGIRSNLVDRTLRSTINDVMAGYDPINSIKQDEGGNRLGKLSDEIKTRMQAQIGDKIDVKALTIPLINFDEATQNRINDLQSEIARTRVANQKEQTSTAEARSNKALQASLSNEVLTSKCLDIVAETKQSPLGCFPGENVQPVKNTQ